jgi:hypothetical protein
MPTPDQMNKWFDDNFGGTPVARDDLPPDVYEMLLLTNTVARWTGQRMVSLCNRTTGHNRAVGLQNVALREDWMRIIGELM